MISTDHDKHIDYSSFIDGFGLAAAHDLDHRQRGDGLGAEPARVPELVRPHQRLAAHRAARTSRATARSTTSTSAPNWIFSRLRDAGAEVIQYNHPRAGVSGITTIGYFNNIGCKRCANDIDTTCVIDTDCPAVPAPQDCTCVGYQPDRPIGMVPNDILQDDGRPRPGHDGQPGRLRQPRLRRHGDRERRQGGRLQRLQAGPPRLALAPEPGDHPSPAPASPTRTASRSSTRAGRGPTCFGVGDDPAALDVTAMNDAIKAGATTMAAGPYVEFFVRTSGGRTDLGGLAAAPDGNVRLKIKVRSAAWMPVEEVRVVANGFVVASFDANTQPRVKAPPSDFESPGRTARFRATVNMNVTQDTYFLVEAGAKLTPAPVSPPIVDIIEPEIVPTTVTNPIYVDRNGNTTFDPPGLPVEPLAFNTHAERPMFARVSVESEDAGLWTKLWLGLTRLASRLGSEAVAQKTPGEMTGITKEQKEEAVKEGEYFPLHEFKLTPEQVEEFIRQKQAETAPAAPTGGK